MRVTPNAERDDAFELHAGSIFQRRVLTLRCGGAAEADLLIRSLRSLLRLMSLGDRAFTMYVLQLFKLADRDHLGAITSKNRRMALVRAAGFERSALPLAAPQPLLHGGPQSPLPPGLSQPRAGP